MIIAKDAIKDYITNQVNKEEFAKRVGITRQTLYNVMNWENVSSEVIAKLLSITGFDFEKAFEVKEGK